MSRGEAFGRILFTCGLLLLLPVALGFVGLGVGMAWNEGSFVRWQRLPDPPQRPARLLGGAMAGLGPDLVYVETADSRVYSCRPYGQDECWQEAQPPESLPATDERCKYRTTWYRVADPPGRVTDRIQLRWCNYEAGAQVDLVLLEDASVWMWEHWNGGYASLLLLFLPVVGGCGLGWLAAVGLAILIWWSRLTGARRAAA